MKLGAIGTNIPTRRVDLRRRRVRVLASFDSFLRAGKRLGDLLARHGATVDYAIVHRRRGQLSVQQCRAAGLTKVPPTYHVSDLIARQCIESFDILVLALDGRLTRELTAAIHQALLDGMLQKRPILISLYPGILFRMQLEGMMSRSSSDIVLLNSPHDLEIYSSLTAGIGRSNDNGICMGVASLPHRIEIRNRKSCKGGAVLYIDQPTVPAGKHERMYILHRLVQIARRHPTIDFFIKPRHRSHETTLHRMRYHYEDLFKTYRQLHRSIPPNVKLTYEPMSPLLARSRLCLAVSSTAALEALAWRVPTRIINDLGINEHLGNHFFLDSDLLASFDEIQPDMPFVVNSKWVDRHIAYWEDHEEQFLLHLANTLSHHDARPDRMLALHPRLFTRTEQFSDFSVRMNGRSGLHLLGGASSAFPSMQLLYEIGLQFKQRLFRSLVR